jgi:hypothetical protein
LNAEILNAIFSGLTLVVFVVTAIAAVVQLRHLRSNTSLQGLTMVLQDWQKPEMQAWIRYVRLELPEKLKDPAFCDEFRGAARRDRTRHPELHVCDYWEQCGTYIKYGMIDRLTFLDSSCTTIVTLWQCVYPAVVIMRERGGPSVYENFEFLAVLSKQWIAAHPNGAYPANMPRWDQHGKPS